MKTAIVFKKKIFLFITFVIRSTLLGWVQFMFVPYGIEEVASIMMGLIASSTGQWKEGVARCDRVHGPLFAAMTPVPVITLYGPETPTLYGSLSPGAFNFHVPLSCSPCLTAYNHRNSPCDGDNVCLKMISPEEVFSKVHEMLKGNKDTALPSV